MKKVLTLVLLFITTSVFTKTLPNLLGAWKGACKGAAASLFVCYSTDVDKEKSVRFKKMEFFWLLTGKRRKLFWLYERQKWGRSC